MNYETFIEKFTECNIELGLYTKFNINPINLAYEIKTNQSFYTICVENMCYSYTWTTQILYNLYSNINIHFLKHFNNYLYQIYLSYIHNNNIEYGGNQIIMLILVLKHINPKDLW